MDHLPDDGTSGPAGKSDEAESDPPVDLPSSDPAPSDPAEPCDLPKTTSGGEEPLAAHWLGDNDFLDATPGQSIALHSPLHTEQLHTEQLHTPRRLPGPGLPEAAVWAGGVLVVHLIGGILTAGVLIIARGLGGERGNPQQLMHSLQEMMKVNLVPLLGGEMLIFVLCALVASKLRLRPRVSERLGLRPIPVRHLLGLTVLCLPLSLTCGQLYWWAMLGWQKIVDFIAPLKRFDEMNSIESILLIAKQASLPMMLFLVAVLPAVGEELVFRGVIGRGLIARWGLMRGVILTSLFFAMVHLHPAHALALLPLAVCIHLVYLATRSFWAPVALHFLNNAWATVLLKNPGLETRLDIDSGKPIPLLLFAASAVCAFLVMMTIWRSRVRYVLPDGKFWTPGYNTVEVPPAGLHAVAQCRRVESGLLVAAALGVVAFAAVLWQTIAAGG